MRALPFALALVLVASCGEPERELREWQPSDHQSPSGREGEGDTRAAPPPEAEEDPVEAERRAATALFRSLCASCHGEAGHGDGPARPPVAQVADLASAEWQDQRSDGEIAQAIVLGRGGFMPAFGDRLTPAGVEALVRHVRRLGGRDASGASAAEAAPTGEAAPAGAAPAEPAPAEPAPAGEAAPAGDDGEAGAVAP